MATKEKLREIENPLFNFDVNENCRKKRADTKWKFQKLTKIKKFAALLTVFRMNPLLKNFSAKCLPFEENTGKPYNDKLFFSEFWRCICMDMKDSKRKLPR